MSQPPDHPDSLPEDCRALFRKAVASQEIANFLQDQANAGWEEHRKALRLVEKNGGAKSGAHEINFTFGNKADRTNTLENNHD